jgi:Tfp pilus assembly protein PilO
MSARGGRIWERQRVIWCVAIVLITTCFLALVTRPQMRRIRELHTQLGQDSSGLLTRADTAEAVSQAQSRLARLSEKTARFDDLLPDAPSIGTFLESLARIAQERRLRADFVEPGQPVREGEVTALPIAFKVRGTFPNVHALLQDIERMPRLTRIERLTTAAAEEHAGQVTAALDLKVFFRAPPRGANAG